MTNSAPVSITVRTCLTAGLAATAVTALAAVPVTATGPAAVSLPSIALSAAVRPLIQPVAPVAGAVLGAAAAQPGAVPTADVAGPSAAASGGDAIINAYNAIEPWVQWGFEVGAWAVSYLPWPLGYLGQQINIGYSAGEPIVQAFVYSFAYLIDGQFDLIGPTLTNGFKTSFNNLVQGEINWFLSFFPPLPPINFPIFPGAAMAGLRTASASAVAETPEAATDVAAGDPAPTGDGAAPSSEDAGPGGTAGSDQAPAADTGTAATESGTANAAADAVPTATEDPEEVAQNALEDVESPAQTPLATEAPDPTRGVGPRGAGAQSDGGSTSADAQASSGAGGGTHKAARQARASRSAR